MAQTFFLGDAGDDPIGDYDASGNLLRRYIPGLAIDRPLAMIDYTNGGAKTFFHTDKTGSVVAMSGTTGRVAEGPYLYDPFGTPSSAGGVPFKFDGMRYDTEIGCYYDRARIYCPATGRFLQTDPIGYSDDIDWYTWVGNDPTDQTDPTGNCPQCAVAPIAAWAGEGTLAALCAGPQALLCIAGGALVVVGGCSVSQACRDTVHDAIGGLFRNEDGSSQEAAGEESATNPTSDRVKKRPGRNGKPDHIEDVTGPGRAQAEEQAEDGEQVLTEQPVQGHPGLKRLPDNQIVDKNGKTRLVVESERRPNGQYHKNRLEDYKKHGIVCQTRELPKQSSDGAPPMTQCHDE